MKIGQLCRFIESIAPIQYQEAYDNSGLATGSTDWDIKGVLLTLDVTDQIVDEAIALGYNLIISHHPVLFRPIKSLSGGGMIQSCLIKAIKHDIAIYSVHTNFDNIIEGVNAQFADKIGLKNRQVLKTKVGVLQKLEFFVPVSDSNSVLKALHQAGAGNIGNYSECSFSVTGKGRFTPSEMSNPVIGKKNHPQIVDEEKVELIFPANQKFKLIETLLRVHPYEEVAYYITSLENANQSVGSGLIGELEKSIPVSSFLKLLKSSFRLKVIRHSPIGKKKVKRVAICGGSGAFLINDAIKAGADVYITGDLKYHDYFEAEGKIILVDIGHYESEIGITDLFTELLSQNFPNIAVAKTKRVTNPVQHFI